MVLLTKYIGYNIFPKEKFNSMISCCLKCILLLPSQKFPDLFSIQYKHYALQVFILIINLKILFLKN